MWNIRPETSGDAPFIDKLVGKSFGPGRFAKSAYRLREGVSHAPALGFVATEHGEIKGSVRFWPVIVGRETALLLGPLAVDSERRGQGMGIALMNRGIEEARAGGYRAIILVGDLPYYARVGFSVLEKGKVRFPGPVDPSRILGLALVDGVLETLAGDVHRARIDEPICADGAALG